MERFTRTVNCPFCGAWIFATRIQRENTYFWMNELDRLPHSCEDFRGDVLEVQPWGYRAGKRRKHYPSAERRPERP